MMVEALKNEPFEDSFSDFAESHAAGLPSWLGEWRKKNFLEFAGKGLPTRRDEDWRYTPTRDLGQIHFSCPENIKDPAQTSAHENLIDPQATRLIFVNGCFLAGLSQITSQKGVVVSSLKSAFNTHAEEVKKSLLSHTHNSDAFAHLTNAFVEDGVFIHIEKNVQTEKNIQLFFIKTGPEGKNQSTPFFTLRHLIALEPHATADITEYHITNTDHPYLALSLGDAILKEGAKLNLQQIQVNGSCGYDINTTRVSLSRDTRFNCFGLGHGGKILRNNLDVLLAGEGAETELNGLFNVNQKSLCDHHVRLVHAVPHTKSEQLFKAVVEDEAKAVFHGLVMVNKAAQKTSAQQTNRNLLLGPKAEVDTRPTLEILADDVKCTHGATVGQLDHEELFYLTSRAIPKIEAEQMLIRGFTAEVVEKIANPFLKKQVHRILREAK